MRNTLSTAARVAACAAATALVLGVLLPACELDDGLIIPTKHRTYKIKAATVLNLRDMTVATFDYGNPVLDAEAPATVDYSSFSPDTPSPTTERHVALWFQEYLKQKLAARAGDDPPNPTFVAMFGSGTGGDDWCLMAEPSIEEVTPRGELEGPAPHALTGDRLLPCTVPMPPECDNPPGVVPVLQFNPPSPFSFPDVEVGSDSGLIPISLRNAGGGTLCLLGLRSLQGDTESFTLEPGDPTNPNSCVPHPANPLERERVLLTEGATCTLRVSFHPPTPGLHRANLPVVSNDPAVRSSLELRGASAGGRLELTADLPAFVIDNSLCAIPLSGCVCVPQVSGRYEASLRLENVAGGVVTIQSGPGDMNWPIDSARVDDGTASGPPWVLQHNSVLRFHVFNSTGDPSPGTLSFAGNQEGGPEFNIGLNQPGTCP